VEEITDLILRMQAELIRSLEAVSQGRLDD